MRRPKFVIVLRRENSSEVIDGKLVEYMDEVAVVGAFNSRERAELRAGVIRREADGWEDPEGVTGPANGIHVSVVGMARGAARASDAVSLLYDSIPPEAA